jgi:hypothetical protein
MQMKTYYLSSLESVKFEPTRRCDFVASLRLTTGKSCVLVRISPAISLQEYNLTDDVDTLVLVSRHEGQDITAIQTFPFFVFIARALIANIQDSGVISKDNLQILAWGELYRTKEDADEHRFD